MNKSSKLVQGIGIKGMEYPTTVGGKYLKEYAVWSDMLFRCTQKLWDKKPTYTGVTCSENFKSYSFFYEWCKKQKGFNKKDNNGRSWCLDKDLLVKGNKVYSEDTCIFIPERINTLLITCNASRGEYPVGVCFNKQRSNYKAQCNIGKGVLKHLGCFNTPQEAFQAYKTFKEALIKEVANEYKYQLDPRVYEALMNYEVNEND